MLSIHRSTRIKSKIGKHSEIESKIKPLRDKYI